MKKSLWRSAALAVVVLSALPGRAGAVDARTLSRTPLSASSAWKADVIDDGRAAVYPATVQVTGDAAAVTDPDGLKAPGGAATTIRAIGPGAPAVVVDLGRNTGGHVEVGITRTDGGKLQLGYSEYRDFLTPAGDYCGCNGLGFSLGLDDDPEGRSDVIDTAATTSFRSPIRGGERYINLQMQSAGSVSIDYVRVVPAHLRTTVAAHSGTFHSSDRLLNRIWAASVYTFGLDAFRDQRIPGSKVVVTDAAKRDRLIWLGDLVTENQLGQYSLRQAPQIIRDSLQAFSCLQYPDGQLSPATTIQTTCPATPNGASPEGNATVGPINPAVKLVRLPEYTAEWIVALHDYWLYSGDHVFAKRMLPVVRRGLAYFARNMKDGLYATPSTGIVINWHPNDPAGGVDGYTNATLYRALRDAAELERAVGRAPDAAKDAARAGHLRAAMNARLWDPKVGAFLLNTSDPHRNHSQDAQVQAVFAGVTTPARSSQALRFIWNTLLRRHGVANGQYDDDPYMTNYISPYMTGTELLARLGQGQTAQALTLIRRTWGQMFAEGPGTLWERMAFDGTPASYATLQAPTPPFDANGAGFTSLAHGWSGGPVAALSGYVLGLRPRTAGWKTWTVAPQPGDLKSAQGRVTTPHGTLASRWVRTARSFRLTVVAPKGTRGTVIVPTFGVRRRIAVDGRPASGTRTAGVAAFAGRPGTHTYAWTT